ncbi:MAG: hypothetical protein KA712_17280 [Myxococcales bacterium]|nr:hypothetical protein [Myxococcales bacterium]
MSAAVRFGWVLNLDAELELARPHQRPTARLAAQLAHHRALAMGLLGPDDVLFSETGMPLVPSDPGRAASTGLVGRAFCPTPRALRALRAAGVSPEPHPPVEVLRAVNHRAFAHGLGRGLHGQRLIRSLPEAHDLVADGGAYLLKRPLSFAGRGQCRLLGTVDEMARRWLVASLRDDLLLAEPLVRPLVEFSRHGFLTAAGDLRLGRPCVQEVSARGAFVSVRPAEASDLSPSEADALAEAANAVGAALAEAGYFGPFGVDAYRYAAAHGEGFCALSEVNARYTMSFATGFPERPPPL